MKVKKVKLDYKGVRKLLKSQEVLDACEKVALNEGKEIDAKYRGFDRGTIRIKQ